MRKYIFIFLSILFLTGCIDTESNKTEIKVFAASSLTNVVKEFKEKIEANEPDLELILHFGSSRHLVEQIKRGAEFDIFLSASEWDMDKLVNEGLVESSSIDYFAYNDLVVVIPEELVNQTITSIFNKEDIDHIAVGEPKSVPLGRYTYDELQNLGLWSKLEKHFVFGKNATQVIQYVENGQVNFAFVYGSDARFRELNFLPLEQSQTIGYPMGIAKESSHMDVTKRIVDWIMGEEGQKILSAYGFMEKDF